MNALHLAAVRLQNLDPVPEPADVNAGALGLLVFLGLIVALGLLLWAMSRQLKRVNRNNAEGRYDDLADDQRSRPRPEGDQGPSSP